MGEDSKVQENKDSLKWVRYKKVSIGKEGANGSQSQ